MRVFLFLSIKAIGRDGSAIHEPTRGPLSTQNVDVLIICGRVGDEKDDWRETLGLSLAVAYDSGSSRK